MPRGQEVAQIGLGRRVGRVLGIRGRGPGMQRHVDRQRLRQPDLIPGLALQCSVGI
jgi:hypothetical protein